jgi:anti-sigma B factor antagonist
MTTGQSELRIEQVPGDESAPLLFRLVGELDLDTVDLLRTAVGPACASGREVLFDLTRLDFCDSTGIGTFVWLFRQAGASGGRLVLAAPRRPVRDVLKISGVDRAIPVVGRNVLAARSTPEKPVA